MSRGIEERATLHSCRRLVVKIGSALLANPRSGIFTRLAREIAALQQGGCEVVLVTSGAIALGLDVMGLKRRPTHVAGLQAAAAAGQPQLMRRWGAALGRQRIATAQVLLTHADLANRERFLNARRALSELLGHRVLPVINENDSVATDEIRVGDNDRLSAYVASLVDADLLVILTSVDGLFSGNPEVLGTAQRVSLVHDAEAVRDMAGGAGQAGLGTGGMRTKVEAARVASNRAIPVVIASGTRRHVLRDVLLGEDVGTLFLPLPSVPSRKHWIAFTLKPKGSLLIDAGATRAIARGGKSLLPSGLLQVNGEFQRGAMVEISGPGGPVARGLVAYSAQELTRLCGHNSGDIAQVLGYIDGPEVVHRDDLVLV